MAAREAGRAYRRPKLCSPPSSQAPASTIPALMYLVLQPTGQPLSSAGLVSTRREAAVSYTHLRAHETSAHL
eukprot:13308330-Alexandrium_andersonii.AAC.1